VIHLEILFRRASFCAHFTPLQVGLESDSQSFSPAISGGISMKSPKSSIVTAVLVFAVAMLAVAPAKAATPFILKVPVDFTGTSNDCGFTVVDHNEGSFTVHVFFDKNGDPKIEIDTYALKETWTNPANGMSLSTTDAGPLITTFHKDGTQTQAEIGLVTHVVLKGQGTIAAEVGRIVYTLDAAGEITGTLFEAGKNDDPFPAICAAIQ
jgi:hypothetical protein